MTDFSHLNHKLEPAIVNVSGKAVTRRKAIAKATVDIPEHILQKLKEGDFKTPKGSVFQTAIIAGIMAAKKTFEIIPMCHLLMLTKCSVDFEVEKEYVLAQCTVKTKGKTGVEMEALTGVNVALLTIYDMLKAVDRSMEITDVRLLYKNGGKSGEYKV